MKYIGSKGINFSASTPEEAEKGFDVWAESYEEDCKLHQYNGPKQLAEIAGKHLKSTDLILVSCVGTGRLKKSFQKKCMAETDNTVHL